VFTVRVVPAAEAGERLMSETEVKNPPSRDLLYVMGGALALLKENFDQIDSPRPRASPCS
jgi:hypothetical protein